MKNKESSSELENVKILSHDDILSRVKYLNAEKGIMYKNIASEAKISKSYFLQIINENFPNQKFQEKSQLRMSIYFKKPEIKAMLKDFRK